jgi:hypothetical protein
VKTYVDDPYFFSDQTCFERVEQEEVFIKDVNQHEIASMRFHDILQKEQFCELLWRIDFSIKGMQTN